MRHHREMGRCGWIGFDSRNLLVSRQLRYQPTSAGTVEQGLWKKRMSRGAGVSSVFGPDSLVAVNTFVAIDHRTEPWMPWTKHR